jgi:hypothetical protein
MEAVGQQELFPVLEEKAKKRSFLREFLDAIDMHGPMVARAHIPIVLDLSRQRVHQLIDEGRLGTVHIRGHDYVPLASLQNFLSEERKTGVHINDLTLAESYRRNLPRLFGR